MNAGEVIQSRYELTELLGKGGMAEVWRAVDGNLNRSVAIKFLAPELSDDPEFLVRFFAEAQAVARISHPGIVQVLDFGDFEDRPYLVMEVVGGGPLSELTGDPIEPDRAFAIVAGAAAAAGAAHELGIVHRDIKPGNILMDDDGGVKLADFGIAASGRSERLTATGVAIGSPHYISPEQASGGVAAPASDVYALGVVLYELLCGVRPFEGDNVTAIAIAHVDQTPTLPSDHIPELGTAVDALVLRALAKDPAERFVDGNELAAALESFDPGVAFEAAAIEESSSWWADRKVLAGAAVAALVLAVPLLPGLTSRDGAVATADGNEDPLPNVGGLRKQHSPTPTDESLGSGTSATSPTPSPTANKEEKDRSRPEPEGRTGSGSSGNEEPAAEPTPDPDETASEPTPAPSQPGASPPP